MSVQPGVLDKGVYILTASIAGIVDKSKIIDGSKIQAGDKILALSSNGLHTNGYSLLRHLMETMPQIQNERIGGETFLDAIMKPHTPYYKVIKGLFGNSSVHGMAHITDRFTNHDAVKWNAVKAVVEYYNINADCIITFGNDVNDKVCVIRHSE